MTDAVVALFERRRATLRRQRRVSDLALLGGFIAAVLASAHVAGFTPARLAAGAPRIFEYFGSILPSLDPEVLFIWRAPDGKPVPGSLGYWFAGLPTYLRLILETILMAITATLLGAVAALALSFPAARNLAPAPWIYWASRRFMEFCRGVPEILFALVFVYMVGVGPLAGVLAIAVHSIGALGKLFAEVNENASPRPVEAIRAVGGTWTEQMALGVLPQVTPNFTSYALLRFEINVRASAIVGFVGAGGIGQEVNRVISFYADDRVSAVLILIVLTVTAIDLVSERVRTAFIGRDNL